MITRLRNYTFARRSRDKSSQPVPLPSYVRRLFLRGGRVAPSRSLDPKVIGFNLIGAPRYDGSDKADKGNGSITIVDHQRENLRDLLSLPFVFHRCESFPPVTLRRVASCSPFLMPLSMYLMYRERSFNKKKRLAENLIRRVKRFEEFEFYFNRVLCIGG